MASDKFLPWIRLFSNDFTDNADQFEPDGCYQSFAEATSAKYQPFLTKSQNLTEAIWGGGRLGLFKN